MLQRKRENDLLKLRINNDFGFQKENFTIQKNESGNIRNEPQPYLINYDINSCKKSFCESLDNSYPKLNNKINIITDDKKANLNNTSIINNNSMKTIRYFNIIKNKYIFISMKSIENSFIYDKYSQNNEIKVLKNKKAVYVNRYLLNSYSTSRSLKKLEQSKFEIRKKTSSKYRGVSKNGNKWQVLIMINNKKYYKGSYLSEEIAARIYDIMAIKNFGIKARTNFIYNHIQIKKIKESKINIDSDNINEIMEQLIN